MMRRVAMMAAVLGVAMHGSASGQTYVRNGRTEPTLTDAEKAARARALEALEKARKERKAAEAPGEGAINYGDARLNALVLAEKDEGRSLEAGHPLVGAMEKRLARAEEAFAKELGKFAFFFTAEQGVMREGGTPVGCAELLEDWTVIRSILGPDDGVEEVSRVYELARLHMKRSRKDALVLVRDVHRQIADYATTGGDAEVPWRAGVTKLDAKLPGYTANDKSPMSQFGLFSVPKGTRVSVKRAEESNGSPLWVVRGPSNRIFLLDDKKFRTVVVLEPTRAEVKAKAKAKTRR